ncbi:MAG TPA: methyltransferase domain-containing protein [Candidatus Nanoarchaeia archaeon]|nr:methyltransferase domain-containing protein [Candidatus Nanoarchaeia archaeon]
MPRILIKKPLPNEELIQYFVKDTTKDYHCEFGFFKVEELAKPDGSIVKSNTGTEFVIFSPGFTDLYQKVTRGPQMIPPKDLGPIVIYCGLGKESKIVEGGAGSGGISCTLAHICKEVTSYDINQQHLNIVEKNKNLLGLTNLTLKLQDITKQIDERDVDAVILDLPSPWLAIDQALKAAKIGGFIVSYSPNISQVMEFSKQIDERKDAIRLMTLEVVERDWRVDNLIVHPRSKTSIHSGFLTFVRRIV